ncbi:MAG: hypothetical protein Q4D77_01760 [Peptostreptococcaceae bacterium]|nr:hypothetical protein [Peptostreptococcaceae bacterium]
MHEIKRLFGLIMDEYFAQISGSKGNATGNNVGSISRKGFVITENMRRNIRALAAKSMQCDAYRQGQERMAGYMAEIRQKDPVDGLRGLFAAAVISPHYIHNMAFVIMAMPIIAQKLEQE